MRVQRSEALGLCLAAFSLALPYLGRFLEVGRDCSARNGINSADRQSLPEGSKQIFIMSEELSDTEKEDMAWASYAILRNTNTMSVLIRVNNALCIRGYWNTPEDVSRVAMIELFKSQIQQSGLLDLKDALYFPKFTDSQLGRILPKETLSLLVQPVMSSSKPTTDTTEIEGFVLLASNSNYAYSDKDRAWIRAVASKFQDMTVKEFQGI
ncbi:Protein COFACTOR ASSEMBLY OF COMPLEX C SUBUNIT B CCB2, chloroplastic [Ananas comosus]|uniref:Protein COFACTOR ASSEMBLY OF COMPLEX C SUBUNIT B CCB2, chloroplastic n=1 Tax=Ananas comosus TaxID=4615 RepID=A0A199VNX9_ANACO|nr:Protein COFACTOR ASSEMBLY OF COMPLEX C SUBUNIT B CCB2, chloroplastic [Ananas comosus]